LHSQELNARFATWLLRPYLDLAPLDVGPLHAQSLEEGWRAFNDPSSAWFIPQRAMSPGFRMQVAEEAGGKYALSDPRELHEQLRTDRWSRVCEALDGWTDLSIDRKCRLASLLHSMCLYQPLLALIPGASFVVRGAEPGAIQLAFWRASASYIQNVPKRISDYRSADMSLFEDIALHRQDAIPACFNATTKVFVHKAKTGAAAADLIIWGKRFENALARATVGMDAFTAELHTRRFYRAMGFLPQRSGDRSGVVRTMDLAEHHAHKMEPTTSAEVLLHHENLHALMESRTKEALWLGDRDLALTRTLKVVEVDPYDSKAWVEVGEVRHRRAEWREAAQAYATAALLGPPASAVGRHLAGVCLRKLDLDSLATLFFKDTLEIDPLGISPREEIQKLADMPVMKALKTWSRNTTEW
jgi:hypothetical protein